MAATAQAATLTITPVKSCYQSGEEVSFAATGFTPNASVDFTLGNRNLGSLLTDAAGNISSSVIVGGPRFRGVKPQTFTATDRTNPALVSSAVFTTTSFEVRVSPERARAGKMRRLRGFGFLAGPRVFMHVRGPGGFKSDKKVANAKAPCGTFRARARIVPAGADAGRYRVQFDAVRRFSRRTKPKLVGTLTVFRTSAARAATATAGAGSWAAFPRSVLTR